MVEEFGGRAGDAGADAIGSSPPDKSIGCRGAVVIASPEFPGTARRRLRRSRPGQDGRLATSLD
jgi:hypothetical protein